MSTLRQYRYDLLETINKYSDDSSMDYRSLDWWITTYRVKWLENLYNKFNKQIPEIYFQTLECIDVALVDSVDCCDVDSDCKILRTVNKLPQFLSLIDGEVISKVSGPDIVKSSPKDLFQIIRYEQAEFSGHGRYNRDKIFTFLYNNYLYFIAKEDNFYLPQLSKINVRGIFHNPMDASRFKTCAGEPCWSPEDTYPLEPRVWTYIKQDILANEIKLKLSMPQDDTNDTNDNTLPDTQT